MESNPNPTLTNCHGCNLKSNNLQLFSSLWRLVLLCPPCHARILYTACSYCFRNFSDTDHRLLLRCIHCSRRIHFRCAPLLRGYIAVSDLHPDSFGCTDCRPLIRPKSLDTCRSLGISMTMLVREAVEEMRVAAERARAEAGAQRLLRAAVKGKNMVPVNDEQLALQLHLEMNGSRRRRRTCSGSVSVSHGVRANGKMDRKDGGGGYGSCERVVAVAFEFVQKDANMEFDGLSCEVRDREKGVDVVQGPAHMGYDRGSCNCNRSSLMMDAHDKGSGECGKSSLVEVLVQEGQGSCSRSCGIEMALDEQSDRWGRFEENTLVEVPVTKEQVICDRSSSSNTLSDQMKVIGGSSLAVEAPVIKPQTETNVFVREHFDEKKNQKNGSFAVPVTEDHMRCDRGSPSVKLDSNGYSDSYIADVTLKEHEKRLADDSLCELPLNYMKHKNGVDDCIDINLVDIPVDKQGGYSNDIGSVPVSCETGESNGTPVLADLRVCGLKGSMESQKQMCSVSDRYRKKYSRKGSVESQKQMCGVSDRYRKKYSRKGSVESQKHMCGVSDRYRKKYSRKVPTGVSDRYKKKYSRRHSRLEGIMDRKESQLVPCGQMRSSELSRSLSNCTHQASPVPMHSSPHTSSRGCR